MQHNFTLVFSLEDDAMNLEPAMQQLGRTPLPGAHGAGLAGGYLSIWFKRDDGALHRAIEDAKAAVAELIPEAKFIKVRQSVS